MLNDFRIALRRLAKSPRFTLSAIAMLALGIGINAVVFTIANGTLFKGFPLVKGGDRIAYITTGVNCCVSYPDFEDWRTAATSDSACLMSQSRSSAAASCSSNPRRAAMATTCSSG